MAMQQKCFCCLHRLSLIVMLLAKRLSGFEVRLIGFDPVVSIERAEEMLDTALQLLPCDIAVMVAAVADWRVAGAAGEKIKKKMVNPFQLSISLKIRIF